MRTKESKFKVSRLDYIEPVEAWKKFESYSNVIFLDRSAGEQSEKTIVILILQLVHYVILKLKIKNCIKMILKLKME